MTQLPVTAPYRHLDFIVIGVQKGGTTSLWEHLRHHPRIVMPEFKEAPVFSRDTSEVPQALAKLMDSVFGDSPEEAKLGKAATYYMMGQEAADVDLIAERIAEAFPRVRLIALLRDPIERAMSHYRMLVRRGVETRSFEGVVEEQSTPEGLEVGRKRPNRRNSYLAQGEYGRILGSYLERFPAEQIHTVSTAAYAGDPGQVLDGVLSFLGLSGDYRPVDLTMRHYESGARANLDPEGEVRLRAYMKRRVWPKIVDDADRMEIESDFDSFLRSWNAIVDDRRPALSASSRKRLEAHYSADAESLKELGVETPWLESWGS